MKKIIISEKFLTELNISNKNKDKFVDYGGFQYAFRSSDPEKIIKFGRESNEDEEDKIDNKLTISSFVKRKYDEDELYQFQEMAKYPKYFPIIYKISKYYVLMEKLDAEKARKEYNEIVTIIQQYDSSASFRKLLYEYKEIGDIKRMSEYHLNIHRYIREYFREKNDFSLLNPYNKFMELVKNIANLKLFELDIHSKNFGYDRNNNLKMLDV